MNKPGDTPIKCSAPGCPNTRPRLSTDDYARAAGWHIYRWHELWAQEMVELEKALCPDHAGNRPREKAQPLEGEQTLW